MKSFIIKNFKFEGIVTEFIAYGFAYKIKNDNFGVKELILVKPELMNGLIIANFNKHYKKILEYYFSVLESIDEDDSDADGMLEIALNEITRLRNIITKKYQKFLSVKETEKILKKLKLIENEIRTKVIDIKLIKEQEKVCTTENHKSR